MKASERPLCLWAAPRTVSTAFDRMMRQRGDHTVLTEPFSCKYLFFPQVSGETACTLEGQLKTGFPNPVRGQNSSDISISR